MQQSMRLKYEPSPKPPHTPVKQVRLTFSDGEKITKMMRVTFEERVIGKEYEIRAKVASSPLVQGYLAHYKTPIP